MPTEPNEPIHSGQYEVLQVIAGKEFAMPRTGNGLTKREYFAGQIFSGIYAGLAGTGANIDDASAAKWAVDGADALIAALNQKGGA